MESFRATVELFPGKGGWHYVRVPQKLVKDLPVPPKWQFIKADVTINGYTWQTSLLPFGDGTQFLALKKTARDNTSVKLDDTVTVSFKPKLN